MSGESHAKRIVDLLKSETNLEILAALSIRPSHPRELSLLLGKDESDISRRLKSLEKTGLVRSSWVRVGSKNVKAYSLTRESITLKFSEGKVFVSIHGFKNSIYVEPRISLRPPLVEKPIGRDQELSSLENARQPVIHVWAPPDYGKTHLVSFHVTKSFKDRPVMWYYSDRSDSLGAFSWKIGSILIHSGYRFSEPLTSSLHSNVESLLEGLETTRSVLVIDDYDKLQNNLKKAIIGMARRVRRCRLFLISRTPIDTLVYSGNSHAMQLGPLTLQGFSELLSYYGATAPPDDVEKSYKILAGIPGLAKMVAKIWDRKEPLRLVSRRVMEAYISGRIFEELGEPASSIVKILASAKTRIPISVLCKISSKSCNWLIDTLKHYGIIDLAGNYAIPRHHIASASPKLDPRERTALAKIVREMARQPSYMDKVRAVLIAARNCMPREVLDLVEERLLWGENWILPNVNLYIRSLKKMLRCRNLSPREYMTFKTELFMIDTVALRGDVVRIEREIAEYVNYYKAYKPAVQARLMSAAGAILMHMKNVGRELVLEALRIYRSLSQPRYKRLGATILLNSAMAYVYSGNLDEALKLDKEYEALLLEDPEGTIEDYFIFKGVIASHMSIAGLHEQAYPIVLEAYEKIKEYKLSVAIQVIAEYLALNLLGLEKYNEVEDVSREVAKVSPDSPSAVSLTILEYLAGMLAGKRRRDRRLEAFIDKSCRSYRAGFIACTLYSIAKNSLQGKPDKARELIQENLATMPGIAKIGENLVDRLSGK